MNKIIIKQIHKDKEVRIALLFDYDKNINECQSKRDIDICRGHKHYW